jgi:hypothetical protein
MVRTPQLGWGLFEQLTRDQKFRTDDPLRIPGIGNLKFSPTQTSHSCSVLASFKYVNNS